MTSTQLDNIKFLSRLKFARKKIDSLAVMKESDDRRANDILEGFPDKNDKEAFDRCTEKTDELRRISAENYLSAVDEYNRIYSQTSRIINSISDQGLAEVLRLRYIDDLTWEEIAIKTYYSLRNVKYMHKKALDLIEIQKS